MPIPKNNSEELNLSAKERVYDQVQRWIVDGTLAPGEKLVEADLADYFAVSRTPVREALLLLAEHKFVDVFPSRGSFVSVISIYDADMMTQAISALQGEMAAIACQNRTDEDIVLLEKLNGDFEKHILKGKIDRVLEADRAFHNAIASIAANPYLKKYTEYLQPHLYRIEYLLEAHAASDRKLSLKNHQDLIAAIDKRDEDAARTAAGENWLGQYSVQRKMLVEILDLER